MPLGRLGRMPELPEELRNRPPRKPGQEPTASLTLEAYARLRSELDELMTSGRQRIAERLKVAREHGDIRENAEYDAAKDAQGLMESQIRRLQEALRDPEIVEAPVDADHIAPHMLVTVRSLDDEDDEETYLLAEHGEEKAPGARTVTTTSPLGTALVGASKGQEVVVDAPGGSFRYEVVGFEPFAG
jgi:transcription elongation factor GreA